MLTPRAFLVVMGIVYIGRCHVLSETSGCHLKLSPHDSFPQLEHQKLKLSYRG